MRKTEYPPFTFFHQDCAISSKDEHSGSCPLPIRSDLSKLTVVELALSERLVDYREAMSLANDQAETRLGGNMLLSWYDRDRDFESPQHVSKCHLDSAVPGYVDDDI